MRVADKKDVNKMGPEPLKKYLLCHTIIIKI